MPDVLLTYTPSDLLPDVVLTGGGEYEPGDEVTISAPTDVHIFSHWGGSFWSHHQDLFPDNTLPSQTFTIPDSFASDLLRMTANYESSNGDDDTDDSPQWPINFQRNVTNVDDLSDNLEEIIEERFGAITLAQSEMSEIDIPFPQTTHWVENNQSFLEGEPVVVAVWFNQGYQFENWYQTEPWVSADDGFVAGYNYSSAFNFDMVVDVLWFQLNVRAVGPFNLTVSKNMGVAGSMTQTPEGNQFDLISTDPFEAALVNLIANPNYGYEFVEWVGDVEFIADGYTVNDLEIEVNVMTNISLEAVFQETEEQEVFVNEQSVGPYTGLVGTEEFTDIVYGDVINDEINGRYFGNYGGEGRIAFGLGILTFDVGQKVIIESIEIQNGDTIYLPDDIFEYGPEGYPFENVEPVDLSEWSMVTSTTFAHPNRLNVRPIEFETTIIESNNFFVFEPKQGRDLIVLDPEVNDYSSSIVEERDGRFSLGTYTLNNRDFWESITFDKVSRNSYIDPKHFAGEVQTAVGELINTPDGPTVATRQTNYFSVETLPFVKNPITDEVVPLNEYYDKELEKENYELATEGKVNLKFGVRSSGRSSIGNIILFSSRSKKIQVFKDFVLYWPDDPGTGCFLTSLDWGDGSKIEFASKPKLVEEASVFNHVYEKPGFYTIRGVFFLWNNKTKYVAWWEKFESNLLINPSKNYKSELYNINNFAMVGGISSNSTFIKTLYNLTGYNPNSRELRESTVIDSFNELDKIELVSTLCKFDSENISNESKDILESYSSDIVNANGNKIHNGFIDKRFNRSFTQTQLEDTDISTTKMYKGVVNMWKHLGFENDDSDNPDNDFYWKNIVPKDYMFGNLYGISVQDNPDPTKGSKVPRTPYEEIVINESVTQNWEEQYYYPILPKIDKLGVFMEPEPDKIFFGNKSFWDSDDEAPITNINEENERLILNIDFNQSNTDELVDLIGAFDIEYNTDYGIKLDDNSRIERSLEDYPDFIEKNNRRQAF